MQAICVRKMCNRVGWIVQVLVWILPGMPGYVWAFQGATGYHQEHKTATFLRGSQGTPQFLHRMPLPVPPPRLSLEELTARAYTRPDRVPAHTVFLRDAFNRQRPSEWTFLGPQPIVDEFWSGFASASGRVTAIAIDPTNPNIVYIGGAQGGIWKSTDGGATFQPLTDHLSSLSTGSIAIFPGDPNIIYYGTGEQHFCAVCYYGDGLFKSMDGGNTWVKTAGKDTVGAYIAKVLVDPSEPNLVHLVSDRGYLRSRDGGYTWEATLTVGWGSDLIMMPDNPAVLIAAMIGSGLWKSTDTGRTWTQLTSGLPSSGFQRINIAVSPSHPNILYASFISNGGSLLGLYKSTDRGNTWFLLPNTPNYVGRQGWYDNCIIVHPTNPDIVFAGGVFPFDSSYYGLIRSMDGGNTWQDVTFGLNGVQLHPDIHTLAFGPDGALWVGTDGGVWKSYDLGNTWFNMNATLGITQFYTVAISPDTSVSMPDDILGGTQDNGTVYWSGSLAWNQRDMGDGGPVLYDWASPNIYYTTYVLMRYFTKWDNGVYIGDVTGGWTNDRVSWANAPVVMDPNQPHVIYVGTHRVWKSPDGGNSWTVISGDLTDSAGYLLAIAVAQGNSNLILTGSSNGILYRTIDGGTTWIRLDTAIALFGGSAITELWMDPANLAIVYLSVDRNSGGRVYVSQDTGTTWIDITGDLPEGLRAQSLAVDFSQDPPVLYLGTDYGVWVSIDGGSHWIKQTDVPNVAVFDIAIQEDLKVVVAATHGRGMWMRPLIEVPPVSAPLTDFSGSTHPVLQVYPAVSGTGWFTVQVTGSGRIEVFNLSGERVRQIPISQGRHTVRLSLADLPEGVYFLRFGDAVARIGFVRGFRPGR